MWVGDGSYGTCSVVSHSFVGGSWGNKTIIMISCRLSETLIGGADGRFLVVNVSATELRMVKHRCHYKLIATAKVLFAQRAIKGFCRGFSNKGFLR